MRGTRAAAPKGRCPVGHRGEFPCYSMGICSFFVNFLLSNENFGIFFLFCVNFPWYSIGIFAFFCFLSIFHVIEWEFFNVSIFCQFSLLFNEDISIFPVFDYFACYSMGIFVFFQFLSIFHVIQ